MTHVRWIALMILAVAEGGPAVANEPQQAEVQAAQRQVGQQQMVPQRLLQQAVMPDQFGNARRQSVGPARPSRAAYDGTVTAAAIRQSVNDAIRYLRDRQAPDGSMEESMIHYSTGAGTVMATLAMLAAGAHPASDASVRRALDWLKAHDEANTYYRAVRANVWEYALRKVPYDDGIRSALQKDSDWLNEALKNKEGWRYLMTSSDWDNSVTQYGVLGTWAAARAGIEANDEFWKRMSRHFRSCQNDDGGWGYQRGGSSANMATAGLATMFLVFDMYHGKNFYSVGNPRPFSGGEAADCLKAIDRGMDWLGNRGGDNNDGYYLYGIERTGVASGRKYIGGRNWFDEGIRVVLSRQGENGSIPMSGYGQTLVNTAFCTLFMVYGGAPVAFNKLEYGEAQRWNLNPRDLANLMKHLWSAYERPLNWHSISIDSPVEEFEAPLLFISGAGEVEFNESEQALLRSYIASGGTILAEPSDRDEAFRASMTRLLRQLYPAKDYPSYGLAELPANHGIYTVLKQEWEARPRLSGASDGTRTFFIVSDAYLSADWQMNRVESDAFKLGMNLLFYATDMGELEGKYASSLPSAPPAPERAGSIRVARAVFPGTEAYPRDWDAAGICFQRLAPYVRHVTGRALEETDPVDISGDVPDGVQILVVTGRDRFVLNEQAQSALRRFVDSGGTVLVSALAGSETFARDARTQLAALFGDLAPLPAEHTLATGHFAGGEDLTQGIRFTLPARRLLRERGVAPSAQQLDVCMVDNRPAVVFSEFDLAGAASDIAMFGSRGYRPESARKVLTNILAYSALD